MTGHSKSNSNDDDEVESVQVPTKKTNTKWKKSTQRRLMKKRFETRNHFTILEDNQYKTKCNHCGKIYQCHPRFDGISNIGTHSKVCEAYLKVKREKDERQQKLAAESGEGNASNMILSKGWSQEACRRAISKMIILGKLPFNFVDNKGFRHFCNVVVSQFIVPSRRTISRDVMDMLLE